MQKKPEYGFSWNEPQNNMQLLCHDTSRFKFWCIKQLSRKKNVH